LFIAVFRSGRCDHRGNKIVIVTVSQRKETNMIIGYFSYDAETDTYEGHIATLAACRSGITFRPTGKSGGKEPDYRVIYDGEHCPVEIGAAWKRTSERGKDFLSVSIDDPAFTAPLNTALFLTEDGVTATLVWTRAKPKAAASAPATKAKRKAA
jgi:uncharacterized protein (DUF736 family)